MPGHIHLDEPTHHRLDSVHSSVDAFPRTKEEIPLERLREIVQHAGKGLVIAAIVGGVLGFGVASVGAPKFDGVATLLVMQPNLQEGAKAESVSTLRALLQTNALANSAIGQFHLDAAPYKLTADDFLRDTLILEEVRNTNLIRVHAQLPDAKLAAQLANFIASAAVTFRDDINRQQGSDLRGQLKVMLDDAASRLKSTEQELLNFRKDAQFDLTRTDADSALDQRGQLLGLTVDIEAEKARLSRAQQEIREQPRLLDSPRAVDAEAALRLVDPRRSESTPQPTPQAGATRNPERVREFDKREPEKGESEKGQSGKGQSEKGQSETGTERDQKTAKTHPDERSEIDPSSGLDFTNPYVNPVYQVLQYQISLSRTRLAALEARRRQLVAVQHLGGSEISSLASLYPKEIRLRRLEGDHELAKTMYSEVSLQYERARLQMAAGARLQLVDPAVPPTRPLPRHRTLWALLGAIAGVAAALLTASFKAFTAAR
jgi:uncharacterized protein involved in exopolysaccharide biosynthesis